MTAGWPSNSTFSTSASRAAVNASRSVLQKRHLMAAALMVSPQTGHCFASSLMATRQYCTRIEAGVRPLHMVAHGAIIGHAMKLVLVIALALVVVCGGQSAAR